MIYMLCYDISDPKRLQKTAKTLENFGLRIQKSFFQCEIPEQKMEELKQEVLKIIHRQEDSFFIYPLCTDCSRKATGDGTGELLKIKPFEIL